MMASGHFEAMSSPAVKSNNHGRLLRNVNGGAKFKLIHEGDIQVCRLNHSSTLLSKILSSKFLRKWESHHVMLGDFQVHSTTVSEFFNTFRIQHARLRRHLFNSVVSSLFGMSLHFFSNERNPSKYYLYDTARHPMPIPLRIFGFSASCIPLSFYW